MRMLTEQETVIVSGGDEFWEDVATWGEWAAAGAAVLCAVVLVAPEAVAIGSITEGALFLSSSGEYVTVSSSVIAQGNAAIATALNSAGVVIGAGGATAQVVGHAVANHS